MVSLTEDRSRPDRLLRRGQDRRHHPALHVWKLWEEGARLRFGLLTRISVVTRFTDEETTQFFIQNGQKIETPPPATPGLSNVSGLNEDYCYNSGSKFALSNYIFEEVGGIHRHRAALHQPLVLALSITDDVSPSPPCRVERWLTENASTGIGTHGSMRPTLSRGPPTLGSRGVLVHGPTIIL
jgi:glycosyl hydrolase family 7